MKVEGVSHRAASERDLSTMEVDQRLRQLPRTNAVEGSGAVQADHVLSRPGTFRHPKGACEGLGLGAGGEEREGERQEHGRSGHGRVEVNIRDDRVQVIDGISRLVPN